MHESTNTTINTAIREDSILNRLQQAQSQWKQYFAMRKNSGAEQHDSTTRPAALTKENLKNNDPWGDKLGEKRSEHTRVYCLNLNGLTLDRRGGKYDTICRGLREVQADVFCGQEHNLDTTQLAVRQIIFDTTSQHWERNRVVMGTTPINFHTQYKPGGTMALTVGSLTSRMICQTRDKWGRWVCQEYRGNSDQRLVIMSVYQPIEKQGLQVGKITVAAQQQSLLLQDDDHVSKVREAFRRDLLACLTQYKLQSYEMLVTGDFNEALGEDNDGMSKIASTLGIVDVMATRHASPPPATYARGSRRLDYALATAKVVEALQYAGYEEFNNRFTSDHRGYFFDFDTDLLLGSPTQALAQRARRGLVSNNSKQVTAYIRQKHELLLNCNAFNRGIQLGMPGNRNAFAERLDKDVSEASLLAEKRIPQFDTPAWSKELANARLYVSLLTKQLTALRTHINHEAILNLGRQELHEKAPDVEWILPTTIPECSGTLRQAKQTVATIVKTSLERRDQELRNRITDLETSANLHDRSMAQLLRRLKRAESIRTLFRKLRAARTTKARQGVTRIEIPRQIDEDPKKCTDWLQIDVPSEVLSHLQNRNRDHFGQAFGTPFTIAPLSEHLGFMGTGEYSQQILNGEYDATSLQSNVQLLIAHMAKIKQMEQDPSRPTITAEEFREKLQVWSESTTTSPSGLHLGHYKSLIARHCYSSTAPDEETTLEFRQQRDELNRKQEDLFELHLSLVNYALERGYAYNRWKTVANTILFKDPDNVRIHRTRVIHIYEADYNLALGIKWRVAMQEAEAFKLLNEGQYGSRSGRRATDPVLIEELQLEISRATRKPVVLINYDATACYDRIIPNVGMIVSQKYGVPESAAHMNASTLESAEYRIRTELGLAESGYKHTAAHPIYGTGQGSANSPAIWCFLSSTLFDCYETQATNATYSTPTGAVNTPVGMIGFVDDCNGQANMFSNDGSRETTQTLVQQTARNAQHWSDILSASGGALELSKCSVHVVNWSFSRNGSPFLALYDNVHQQELQVVDRCTGEQHQLPLLSSYKAHKTLGHYKDPTGAQQEQIRRLKKHSDDITEFLWTCPLSRGEAWTYYFACYLTSVGYPLACSSIPKQKLDLIQRKAMAIMIARCGFNRNTQRAIVYGPLELGGASFRHLYVQQGVGQISEFIRNWRLQSTAGRLLRVALSWFQEQTGVSFAILANTHTTLPHLESKWIAALRNFMNEFKMHIIVDTPDIPPLQRMYDAHLMDIIINSQRFTGSEIRRLNYCRLYLKATTISDITHMSGTRLDQSKVCGSPSLYSSGINGNYIHQERPDEKEWRLWKKANTLWSADNGVLHEPLGPWIIPSKQQRQRHRAYRQVDGQYWAEVALWVRIDDDYIQCAQLQDPSQYQETTNRCKWEDLPSAITPVEAWPMAGGRWLLTYSAVMIAPVKVTMGGTFEEYVQSLEPWESELLQMIEVTNDFFTVGDALTHGVRAVSDGSVWDDNQGAFGWTLSADNGKRVAKGMGPARGATVDSFRAEAYGLLSLLCFLRRLSEYLGQQHEWCGILATDSMSLLDAVMEGPGIDPITELPRNRTLKEIRYLDVMDPEWDLTSNIVQIASNMPQMRLQYVRGHQDRTTNYEDLPLLAQLNVDADTMAARYQCEHGMPRTDILLTDTAGACLNTPAGSITKRLAPTVRYTATAPALLQHLQQRNGWSDYVCETINWPAHGGAIRKRMEKRTHLIKLVHGLLPTGKVLHRHDQIRNRCPLCNQALEDWPHILKCEHSSRQKWRQTMLSTVETKSTTLSTRPLLVTILKAGITGWLTSQDPNFRLDPEQFHRDGYRLITQQNNIGWNQVFLGRFSWCWSDMQDDYYAQKRTPGKPKRLTGQRWQTAIIENLWTQWYELWEMRNRDLHGADEKSRMKAQTREIHRELRLLYDSREHMEPTVRDLLSESLEVQLEQPSWVNRNWIAINGPVMKESIRRARHRATAGMKSIRQYFSVR